jgi:4-amino-4-deoxy-L-arabinose transferase-like glycosyltransferase
MAATEPFPSPPTKVKEPKSLTSATAICLFALAILVPTIADYGITWDEANPNFPAARKQEKWFRTLFTTGHGLNEADVRAGFETESDHPSLPRTWMALSRLVLPKSIPDRVAFALPTSVAVALFSWCFFLYLKRRFDWPAAMGGTLLLILHPRWYAHSHFAEYDVPIAIAWWLAAVTFYRANDESIGAREAWVRSLWAAFFFGLALSIKVHAFFLPFPLILWSLLFNKRGAWRWMIASAVVAPLVYIATQPVLWWDTVDRLSKRFLDYSVKDPINVFYLGKLYEGNLPWHYPWVLLAVTMPVFFLVFSAIGLARWGRELTGRMWGLELFGWLSFLGFNAVAIPLVFSWHSPYDGIRLLLVSLPFLAMFAAVGIEWGQLLLARAFDVSARSISAGMVAFAIAAQGWSCYVYHPFQLSFYSDFLGGVRGATRLGFESTYWCDGITDDGLRLLARILPGKSNIATHAMDAEVLLERKRAGTIPEGWTFNAAEPVNARIIQFRQGFFGPLERKLLDSDRPIFLEEEVQGAPLVRVYAGP